MNQFSKIKESYPDTLLLFRVGDFYETFEEDAKTASKVLGITLTKRANGAAGEVPLAGFPYHAIDTYLPKLVRAGLRVAICEQTENPKLAKGLVKREVVEIVTPGVAFTDKILDHKKNNFLLAFTVTENILGVSFCDITTGEFQVYETTINAVKQQIELINPSEILIAKKHKDFFATHFNNINETIRITKLDDWVFNYEYANDILLNHFKTKNFKGFGIEQLQTGLISAGAVFHYLSETQKSNLSHINKISRYNSSDYMILDFATKRNLEIIFSMLDGTHDGSLYSILDSTETSMGARLLKRWVSTPLIKLQPILARQNAVDFLFHRKDLRRKISEELKEIGDLERIISKICTGRANPRELIALKSSLNKIPIIKSLLNDSSQQLLIEIKEKLLTLENIVEKIDKSIVDHPPLSLTDGGVIKNGLSIELDELRNISINGKDWIAQLQKNEREKSGISSLKVSYNKVFGYYIEISHANKDKVPSDYIRKQTLVNSERFITPELKVYEDKILNAEEKIYDLESQLFNELRLEVASYAESIQLNAKLIATLDCVNSFAQTAERNNYTKPEVNDSTDIIIQDGRHPVVEKILPPSEKFTTNSCKLNNEAIQIVVLTGPNMAGKSVYLRQIGLIVLLAQIGSFVPAKSATIGVVDRIFTRVGASDNITSGESTFLVEMQEAANIINNATPKSLILLDEVGRGTSTFDGLSIAWAITEYLHENPSLAAKTLFATHYHELNEMASIFPRIKNYKVEVREYGDKVIFLHKVTPGFADHSYGIQVAQMAGLPKFITDRAKEILQNLESKELTPYEIKKEKLAKMRNQTIGQLSLFEFKDDQLRSEIKDIEVENITPMEALIKLNELKNKISDEK